MSLSILAIVLGGLLLALPLILKGFRKLKIYAANKVKAALPDYLDNLSGAVLDVVFDEAEDAFSKVLNKAAELAKDGKLDDADRKELLALLKEETVGEVNRQIDKLKKFGQ